MLNGKSASTDQDIASYSSQFKCANAQQTDSCLAAVLYLALSICYITMGTLLRQFRSQVQVPATNATQHNSSNHQHLHYWGKLQPIYDSCREPCKHQPACCVSLVRAILTTLRLGKQSHRPSLATTMRAPSSGICTCMMWGCAMMHSPTSMSPMALETHRPPGHALKGP